MLNIFLLTNVLASFISCCFHDRESGLTMRPVPKSEKFIFFCNTVNSDIFHRLAVGSYVISHTICKYSPALIIVFLCFFLVCYWLSATRSIHFFKVSCRIFMLQFFMSQIFFSDNIFERKLFTYGPEKL